MLFSSCESLLYILDVVDQIGGSKHFANNSTPQGCYSQSNPSFYDISESLGNGNAFGLQILLRLRSHYKAVQHFKERDTILVACDNRNRKPHCNGH